MLSELRTELTFLSASFFHCLSASFFHCFAFFLQENSAFEIMIVLVFLDYELRQFFDDISIAWFEMNNGILIQLNMQWLLPSPLS